MNLLQLIPDDLNEDVAQVMMFYRWRRAPILQLLCTVRRQAADGDFIAFASDDGMPLVAIVRLGPSEEDPSATQVVFNIEYRLPTVLVDFAGKLGIHMHVDSILQQNLVVCSSRTLQKPLNSLEKCMHVQDMVRMHILLCCCMSQVALWCKVMCIQWP